ncbi:ABC transporter substrate-binding protein [Thauera humireducens]|uniref:ABC transporter substrate-binding protein n=1 Tax=Thauera humireducens TaxID=1134435 RepID=UPI00311F8352
MTRRDFLRLSALTGAGLAVPMLRAGDAMAQAAKGDDVPVRIGYLPITDATPLLVAHARKLFEAEGLRTEAPRLFRSWAQIVEAFVSGQVNVIHLLSPTTLWVRYGTNFPAKVVAWNHMNGSALTVAHDINTVTDLGGKTVAIPFWYSIHNILLQKLLVANGLTAVTRPRGSSIAANEVNLIVLPPAEMVSALAGKGIAGFIVADPFNAAAEINKVGKVLRFSGDVWKDHACCVTFLSERDIAERPQWALRVTNAIVKAQLWTAQQPARRGQATCRQWRQPLHAAHGRGAGEGAVRHRLQDLRGQRRGPQHGLAPAPHRFPALPLPVLHRRAGAQPAHHQGRRRCEFPRQARPSLRGARPGR